MTHTGHRQSPLWSKNWNSHEKVAKGRSDPAVCPCCLLPSLFKELYKHENCKSHVCITPHAPCILHQPLPLRSYVPIAWRSRQLHQECSPQHLAGQVRSIRSSLATHCPRHSFVLPAEINETASPTPLKQFLKLTSCFLFWHLHSLANTLHRNNRTHHTSVGTWHA